MSAEIVRFCTPEDRRRSFVVDLKPELVEFKRPAGWGHSDLFDLKPDLVHCEPIGRSNGSRDALVVAMGDDTPDAYDRADRILALLWIDGFRIVPVGDL